MNLRVLNRKDGIVNCQRREGRTCADKRYPGTVGYVLCAACSHRVPIDPAKPPVEYVERSMTAGEVGHGVAGLARAIAGVDRVTNDVRAERLRICTACEHNGAAFGMLPSCDLCGCLLSAKIADAREACPAGKWTC